MWLAIGAIVLVLAISHFVAFLGGAEYGYDRCQKRHQLVRDAQRQTPVQNKAVQATIDDINRKATRDAP